MRKIRELMRLKFEVGLSHRAIAQACGLRAGTVSEYVRRAREQGLSWPLAEELDDGQLEQRLFRRPAVEVDVERARPDFVWVHQELKRPGVTLMLLWTEYREVHREGYGYSRFCELYRRWAGKLNVSMRQPHRAGEKTFIDFSGQRPQWVNPQTGEVVQAELFVAVLGASSYVYAEATASQELSCWTGAHVRMVESMGGSSAIWVPDNLKSAVSYPDRYEPELNRSYLELARHYGAVVVPARVGKAKDKAKAEVGVQVAERWILARLRHQVFFSLAELNQAIGAFLEELNVRVMKHLGASRRELYEKLDRPALKPLPSERYELREWKLCRVNLDYHVEVDRNFYSVPYTLVREQVEARVSASVVEVYYKDKRVASHQRLHGRGLFATVATHMPRSHREYLEWTPSRLLSWAAKTGPATAELVGEILHRRAHPEQGYRSCLGILRLGKAHEAVRLQAACRRALALGSYSYRTVKNILNSGLDRVAVEPAEEEALVPVHENIRGASYYAQGESSC